jgi:hypothetical protein
MPELTRAQIERAVERAFVRERFSHILFESMQRANKKQRAADNLAPLLWSKQIGYDEYKRRIILALMSPAQRARYLKNELAIDRLK